MVVYIIHVDIRITDVTFVLKFLFSISCIGFWVIKFRFLTVLLIFKTDFKISYVIRLLYTFFFLLYNM